MCVDNGMFTVSFLKEGINKVSPLPDRLAPNWKLLPITDFPVPWMAGRPPRLLMGGLPKLGLAH